MANQNDLKLLPSHNRNDKPKMESIFNPYDQVSNGSNLKPISEKEATIPNLLIQSDGCFGNNWGKKTTDSIYVYRITADVAALQVQIPADYHAKGSGIAMGFYDKSLKDIYLDKDEEARASMAYRTSYLMWHFGSVQRKDMKERKDWIVVPREIFENINDYVYLCICTEIRQGEPVVRSANFPKDRPFFYDSPVATSIYKGQSIKDSKILLGHVMEYKDGEYTTLDGQYLWNDIEVPSDGIDHPTVEVHETSDYTFRCSDNRIFSCPEIKLYIYTQTPEERAKDVTAFVWQSGNDDDEVKKSYIQEGDENPYNTYSHVMDCLSTHTMYRSMVSLTKFTAENAARYAVKALAKQPEGFHSMSIDSNSLVFLMGGAIFKLEFIIAHAVDDNNKLRNLYNEDDVKNGKVNEISIVDDLFAVNGSHLFFDTDVTYEHNPQEKVRYYMQDVLGIEEGSNGCKRIKKLLTDLFAQIATLGVSLDYVYCDIEGPWNDVRIMTSRRFSERYFNSKNSTDYASFCNSTLLEELKDRKEIWNEMLKRGLDLSTEQLSEVCTSNDKPLSRHSFYGLNAKTYSQRRNPNIWDAVMKGYENELFYTYVMAPVLEYNPNAKCSIYEHGNAKGYVNQAQRFETYLGGTVQQNPQMYSCGAIYGEITGEYYKKLCMDNWKMFPNKRNYFSYFVGNINKLRSLLVSTQSEKQRNGKFNAFISSFNIWVNGYLQGDDDEETKQRFKQLAEEDDDTIDTLEAYYNEFMYHVFLCCPDKAIAYFQVETRAINNNVTADGVKTYYFPFGDDHDKTNNAETKYQQYYSNSYSRLQNVLAELNEKIGKSECETMVTTLASENEPYVISGVRLKDKKLWRVTLNKLKPIAAERETTISITPSKNKPHFSSGLKKCKKSRPDKQIIVPETIVYDIDINLPNGRRISFANASNVIEGEYGLWIETPLSGNPEFTAENNYYEDNPAYSSPIDYAGLKNKEVTSEYFYDNLNSTLRQEEFVNVLDEKNGRNLKFIHSGTHTVFGEMPKFITLSTKFTLNKTTDSHVLFFFYPFESFYPAIGVLGRSTNGQTFSTQYVSVKEEDKKTIRECHNKAQLTIGNNYELIKYVALNSEPYAKTRTGRIRLELWELEQNGEKRLVLDDERDISFNNTEQEQAYQSIIDIASQNALFKWDDITIHDFKMYFTQQHEKLELFRESDGVNIGRVNKQFQAYANLPVETKWNDTLVGKLSWLNATDKPVKYAITFDMLDGNQELIDQHKTTFKVEANSEGNVMIPLPPLDKSTRRVELTFEKPKMTHTGTGTTFFTDHYNKNRKQTISVEISE